MDIEKEVNNQVNSTEYGVVEDCSEGSRDLCCGTGNDGRLTCTM
jgi:hypothetical protein